MTSESPRAPRWRAPSWWRPPPWLARVFRWLGRLAYAGALLLVCGVTAYFAFNLFIRRGVVAVPDLRTVTEQEATRVLAEQRLSLQVLGAAAAYDDKVEVGGILRQEPAPRTLVKRGSTVSVTLSLGPQVIEVPNLSGQTVQSSQVKLAAAGLSLGRALSVVSSERAPGTVVEQRPRSGEKAAPGAAVDVLVGGSNRAEIFLMPDLIYRDYDGVRRFFEQRGFRFGSVKFEVYEGIRAGVILRQFPLAGHPLRRQDAISLVVSMTAEGLLEP